MFCSKCGAKIQGDSKFCVACGNKLKYTPSNPPEKSTAKSAAETSDAVNNVADNAAYQYNDPLHPIFYIHPDISKEIQMPEENTANSSETYFIPPSVSADPPKPPKPPKPVKPPKPTKKKKIYQEPTKATKILSVVLCLLICICGFIAMTIAAVRIGADEGNVRSSCRKGTLADLVINTSEGEKSFVDIVADGAVDSQTGEQINPDKKIVREFLEKNTVNNYVENVMIDYSNCFVFGKDPVYLNADAVGNFLSNLSYDLSKETKYSIPESEITKIKNRVNGGDLSYLSIDSNGSSFKEKYGVNPNTISVFFSVWMLIVFGVLTALFMGLLFFINQKNLPEALKKCGFSFLIFGALFFLLSILILLFAMVKDIYIFSGILKYTAMGSGTISLITLDVGVCFLLLKGKLLKNAVQSE